MKKKEITIVLQPINDDEQAKEVKMTLAYCYATEISYKILSDEDITKFIAETIEAVQQNMMPDIRKSIFLILAAMQAYNEFAGTESPVTDKQLMCQMAPQDLGLAIGTIIGLRSQFYHIPGDEPKNKPDIKKKGGKKEKNA